MRMGGSSFDDNRCDVRTVVLVGKTGIGKSATGNSLLGTKAFKSKSSLAGVTSTCEMHETVLEDGTMLRVIDTPGLFDYKASTESIVKEIARCITMAKDGIHAILLVLSVRSRFSPEEKGAIDNVGKLFGKKFTDYMILVFTGGDEVEENDETLDDYLGHECPEPLKEILKMCGNRCVLFDNKTKDVDMNKNQLNKLLTLVDDVVDRNGGKPFSDELFLEVKKDVDSDQERANLHKQQGYSHSELLKKVEAKLKELERLLAEEQAARCRAEADALDNRKRFEKEKEESRKQWEKMQQETDDLRKQGNCAIQEVELKLKESTLRLECRFAEEQAARFRAEADVMRIQLLQGAQQQSDELRRQAQSGNCAIL